MERATGLLPPTPKAVLSGESEQGLESPVTESNGTEQQQRIPTSGDGGSTTEDRPHSQEPERIVEWGGPNGRYGKLNVILGKGAYKVVWKAIDKEEGIEVAWNCCQTTRTEYNEFNEEVEILKRVRHTNIITFHDSWYSNGEFIFITELMTSGTLREYIKKLKNPSIKIIRRWSRQILKGLIYLHTQSPPIIHRDIKCDNLFINGSHGEVKIGDMGTAKMRFGKKYTVIGTPEFMAPEMYEERGYSEKVDIYAFGMCILEMVTGEYPYAECKNAAQIYKKVTQGIKPECLAKVQDKEVLALILNCLSPEAERWSARKLADHPFLLEEPEVILISANEVRTKLRLQVLFKGHEKHSIKFEYDREKDTAEEVVNEMIEEKVLAAKYQGFVCNEIQRVLRDVAKNMPIASHNLLIAPSAGDATLAPAKSAPEERHRFSTSVSFQAPLNAPQNYSQHHVHHRRIISEANAEGASNGSITIPSSHRSRSRPRQAHNDFEADAMARGLSSMSVDSPNAPGVTHGIRRSSFSNMDLRAVDSFDMEIAAKEYPNNMPIEDFIIEVAALVNRPPEKANEWIFALKNQDVLTVGDLRDLQDEDWALLSLTVFAARAIKNVLRGSRARSAIEMLSPRETGRAAEPASTISNSASQTPTITNSSNQSSHAAPIHVPIITPSSSLTPTTTNSSENAPNS